MMMGLCVLAACSGVVCAVRVGWVIVVEKTCRE